MYRTLSIIGVYSLLVVTPVFAAGSMNYSLDGGAIVTAGTQKESTSYSLTSTVTTLQSTGCSTVKGLQLQPAISFGAGSACPVCGDGTQNGSEQCDGTDLGGASCSSLSLGIGTLSCSSSCTFVTSACTSVQSSSSVSTTLHTGIPGAQVLENLPTRFEQTDSSNSSVHHYETVPTSKNSQSITHALAPIRSSIPVQTLSVQKSSKKISVNTHSKIVQIHPAAPVEFYGVPRGSTTLQAMLLVQGLPPTTDVFISILPPSGREEFVDRQLIDDNGNLVIDIQKFTEDGWTDILLRDVATNNVLRREAILIKTPHLRDKNLSLVVTELFGQSVPSWNESGTYSLGVLRKLPSTSGALYLRGKGVPGAKILATIHSKLFILDGIVDGSGSFALKIPSELSLGEHSLKVVQIIEGRTMTAPLRYTFILENSITSSFSILWWIAFVLLLFVFPDRWFLYISRSWGKSTLPVLP